VDELQVYTPQEVADLLRVDRKRIYDLAKRKQIKALKVGGSWRIPRAEVMRLLGREG
jgi:excisionase family DNA binding protein